MSTASMSGRALLYLRSIILVCALVGAAGVAQGQTSTGELAPPEPVRVVQIGALTKEEASLRRGLELGFAAVARRRVEASKDGVNLRPFVFEALDDEGDVKKTAALLEQRVGKGRIDLVVGSNLDRLGDATVRKLVAEHGLLVFGANGATSERDALAPATLRASLEVQVAALVDKLIQDGCERIAVVVPAGDTTARLAATKALEQHRQRPVALVSVEATSDGRLEATQTMQKNPDACLVLTPAGLSLRFLRRMAALRGDKIVRHALLNEVATQEVVTALGDAADGTYFVSSFPWPWLGTLPISNDYRGAVEAASAPAESRAGAKRSAEARELHDSRVFEGFATALLLERVVDEEVGGGDVGTKLWSVLSRRDGGFDIDGLRLAWPKGRRHGASRAYLSVIIGGKLDFVPRNDEASPAK